MRSTRERIAAMTSLSLLPPIPRPPHDPESLTLGASRDWRASELDAVLIDPTNNAVTLAVATGAPVLNDPTGSFGGLVPPALVAVGEGCDIWLIDAATCALKKFDECACAFIDVLHIGGKGSGARQFDDPRGLAASRGNLFVADTGNGRVSVFAQRGYVLRGTLEVPAGEIAQPWSPVAIAVDHRGRVYVADPNNGCVHQFTFGAWRFAIRKLGDVRHIAVDCRGWLYVVTSGSTEARVFDSHAHEREAATTVSEVRGQFAPLPFRVDADGALDFRDSSGPCCSAFDLRGALLPNGAKANLIKFETDGMFRSTAIDSGIAECQWHRVVLCAAIPAGTSVTVLTRTSEVAEPDENVAALTDEAWETWQTARRTLDTDGSCVDWDCLVRSGPGRFLWLRLRLRGDGRVSPALFRVTLEMPRLSLARWLPGVYGEDPAASEFTDRFLSLFDTTIRSIEHQLDVQGALFDPRSTPAEPAAKGTPDFLSWLASWVGIALDRHWPESRRRRFLRAVPALFDHRGTTKGLRAVLLLYLGLGDGKPELDNCRRSARDATSDPKRCLFPNRCAPLCDPCAEPVEPEPPRLPALLLEHWRLRRWLFVGAGRLGDESMLWGKAIVNRSRLDDGARADVTRLVTEQDPYRDPFHVYASTYSVFLPACVARDPSARKGLENLLRDESPAHTRWHFEMVEPRFRIGVQSMIGYDSVVGRYPKERVTLNSSTLGRSTILGGPPDDASGPSMRVGSTARIGSTTMLN
jgi:phage tail-like protein